MPTQRDDQLVGELVRVAFERSPAGTLVVDEQGNIVLASAEAARLFGYSVSELEGLSVDALVPAALVSKHSTLRRAYSTETLKRPMGGGRVLRGQRKDGGEVLLEIGLNPVQTSQGRFVVATCVDVSAREHAQRRLRESEQRVAQLQKLDAVGTLAGGIAHDFNNILMAIVGYAELLRTSLEDTPAMVADVDAILAAAQRGEELARQLQVFTSHATPPTTAITVSAPVIEALALLRPALSSKVVVHSHFDPATPAVLALSGQIHQIMMNLGKNAVAAMAQEPGVLRVVVQPVRVSGEDAAKYPDARPGLYACLEVSDTGCGIAPESLHRVFEPFFTTQEAGQGSGLGLAVVHGIVRELEGFVIVESEPGRGSLFRVMLPAAVLQPKDSPDGRPSPERGGLRALWVDDEPQLAALGQRQLQRWGIEVRTHSSSLQALEEFLADPSGFDVVVTDNVMPHMSGLELVKQLKAHRPDIPALIVTGYSSQLTAELLQEHGVNRVLAKPFDAAQLRAAISELLGQDM